ncbi:uncharacterized protein PG986_005604 [Apiospora aurea]|uniref:N-acetyltransferase domain-containing protein n=1 Tax=Apiospora aurea TaxID=335848 RepID=A0ABR1QIU9_9PEZI
MSQFASVLELVGAPPIGAALAPLSCAGRLRIKTPIRLARVIDRAGREDGHRFGIGPELPRPREGIVPGAVEEGQCASDAENPRSHRLQNIRRLWDDGHVDLLVGIHHLKGNAPIHKGLHLPDQGQGSRVIASSPGDLVVQMAELGHDHRYLAILCIYLVGACSYARHVWSRSALEVLVSSVVPPSSRLPRAGRGLVRDAIEYVLEPLAQSELELPAHHGDAEALWDRCGFRLAMLVRGGNGSRPEVAVAVDPLTRAGWDYSGKLDAFGKFLGLRRQRRLAETKTTDRQSEENIL